MRFLLEQLLHRWPAQWAWWSLMASLDLVLFWRQTDIKISRDLGTLSENAKSGLRTKHTLWNFVRIMSDANGADRCTNIANCKAHHERETHNATRIKCYWHSVHVCLLKETWVWSEVLRALLNGSIWICTNSDQLTPNYSMGWHWLSSVWLQGWESFTPFPHNYLIEASTAMRSMIILSMVHS